LKPYTGKISEVLLSPYHNRYEIAKELFYLVLEVTGTSIHELFSIGTTGA